MRATAAVIACLVLAGCTGATSSPEQVAARVRTMQMECAKQYKRNSQEYYICMRQKRIADYQKESMKSAVIQTGVRAAAVPLLGAVLSDYRVKRDITRVGELPNGIPLYRFRYLWSNEFQYGVIAQEVRRTMPSAVVEGSDGLLRVHYSMLGL